MNSFIILGRKGVKNRGFMSLKLNMSKTYNQVEWTYLERVLSTLGFMLNMIKLIMNCVKTNSFSVLIKGYPKAFIIH